MPLLAVSLLDAAGIWMEAAGSIYAFRSWFYD